MELTDKKTRNGSNAETHLKVMFMDLEKVISRVLDYMGLYQIGLFVAFLVNSLVYGISHTLTAFHAYTPHFYCKDHPDMKDVCESANETCSGYEFDENDDYTIVSQWSLVCDRKFLAPMVSTLYYVGVTFGALICGMLCDKFGRKTILLMCMFCQGAIGILLRFVTIFELFVVMRTFQGFFVQGIQGSCVALLFEYSAPRLRMLAIILWHAGFTTGTLFLAGMSYLFRDWRMLQLILSIPTLVIICYIWAVPESIYWLYASNRKRKALKLCLKTSTLNRDTKMVEEIKNTYKDELQTSENIMDIHETSTKSDIETATILDLCKSPPLKKHLFIMVFVNYIISVAFYGCMFFINHLSGNHHMNYVISSVADLLAYLLLYVLIKSFGTRFSIILYMYTASLFCAAIGFVTMYVPDDNPKKVIIVSVLAVIAKLLAMGAFTIKVLYNAELFPTICRGAALGACGFFARIGSVSAPFFMTLAVIYAPILPMLLLSVIYFISSTSIFWLPETKKTKLPHSISEAELLWGKKATSSVAD